MESSSQPLPEAAFSITLKGTLGGVDALLTVRGQSYQEFVTNVATVRGLLDPLPSSATPTPSPAPQPEMEGWCRIHGVKMTLQSNERGSWFSHKTAEGWCRGKARKSA
jgi:hypothetical protein